MARQLYIQYPMSTGVWSSFQDVKTLFPGVTYIGSQRIGGGAMKADGIDIPGIHGIYPTYYKTAAHQVVYSFYVRSTAPLSGNNGIGTATQEDKSVLINTVREFTSWLYSMGELHLSEDISSPGAYRFYNRFKYKSIDDYNILMGAFGLDIRLDVTLVAIDALKYNMDMVQDSVAGTLTTARQVVATQYDYNIIDTPLNIRVTSQGLDNQQSIVVYSKNTRTGRTRGFAISNTPSFVYGNFTVDSENQTVTSTSVNLIPYIRPIVAADVTIDSNITIDDTYSYDFPTLEYGVTRVAVIYAVRVSTYTSTIFRSYRRRWL